jgi:hypothetical protein
MVSTADSKPQGTAGSGAFVFDGSSNFHGWRVRVERELLSRQLLGYVLVKGYDGGQTFTYRGDSVPAKTEGGVSQWEALQEADEAKGIVQGFLDTGVEAAILDTNAYDSWALLNALYGSSRNASSHSDMYRAWRRKLYSPNAGSVKNFITQWEMLLEQFSQATGDKLSDSYRSVMLEDVLPKSWRPAMEEWRGSRPFTPYAELVERAVAMGERSQPRGEREESRPRTLSATSATTNHHGNAARCFYCFRPNHTFQQCKYLANDIKNGKTDEDHSEYSCRVTDKRTFWMVHQLKAYVTERQRAANRPSMPRGDRKRAAEIDLTRDEDERTRRSQSRARSVRSRSVHAPDNRARRSMSSSRSVRARRSSSRQSGGSQFFFPPRSQQRESSFERVLGSS